MARSAQTLEKPLLYSVPEAARILNIGSTLAWDLVKRNQLPVVRLGTRVLVSRATLERLASADGHLPPDAR